MGARVDLEDWVIEALKSLGGRGTILAICKEIWKAHQEEINSSEDLAYKWQYKVRWAATRLRRMKKLKSAKISPKGIWELV